MKGIGVKIRERRTRLGWTVQKLATLAEIDRGFLSKLETETASGSWETYSKLAGALGISLDTLIVSESNVQHAPIGWRSVPVLSYRQAAEWTIGSSPNSENERETVMTHLDHPPSSFAMRILGNSMEPRFQEGDVVVIDPTIEPRPGDFIVAAQGSGNGTFREYREAGINEKGTQVFELWPLNPAFATVRSDRQMLAIVGVMVEHRSYRRRG